MEPIKVNVIIIINSIILTNIGFLDKKIIDKNMVIDVVIRSNIVRE